MELNVISATSASQSGSISISDAVFQESYNEGLISQVITAYLAAARQGTSQQKNRSDVSGGGAKPWRQKGMGRARAGTTRGPIWRKGGVTFAARPRDYSQKVNRKMYAKAMKSILSELIRQDRVIVLDDFIVTEVKTSSFIKQLKILNIVDALIIVEAVDEALYLAARNVPHIDIMDASSLNPYSLLRAEKIIITSDALKQIEGAFLC